MSTATMRCEFSHVLIDDGVQPALAWNSAVSFVTNTNWQNYAPEVTMSYLTQMLGLAVQNFVSAAVGFGLGRGAGALGLGPSRPAALFEQAEQRAGARHGSEEHFVEQGDKVVRSIDSQPMPNRCVSLLRSTD